MPSDKQNSIYLAAQYIMSMAVALLGMKLNLLTYGAEEFGVWLLLLSIWGVGAILDMGFSVSLIRYIARHRSDAAQTDAIIATGFLVFTGLGCLLMGTGVGVAELFYFSNPKLIAPHMQDEIHIVHYWLAGNFFFQYLTIFFRALFEGHEDFIPVASISMISSVVMLAMVAFIYFLRLPLPFLGAGYCVVAGLQLFAFYIVFRRRYPKLKIHPRSSSLSTFRSIVQFSAAVQGTFLIGAVMDPVIKYVMGVYGRSALISNYEVARRFATAISGLFSSAFRNSLPKTSIITENEAALSFLHSDGEKLARWGISYSGLMYGILSFVSVAFIRFFYGLPNGVILFFVCALAESVNISGFFLYVFIIGLGKTAILMVVQTMNIIFVVVFLIAGFLFFGSPIGLAGYFLSVIAGNAVMLLFIRSLLGLKIREYLRACNVAKLAALHGCIAISIGFMTLSMIHWLWIQVAFSIASTAIFYPDLRLWTGQVRNSFARVRSALS